MDQFTEQSSQGWFSRIGESIKGVLVGMLLFAVSFPLLWWNEGRSVQTYKSLQEGRGAVVSVSAGSVNMANEGKLVHLTGHATADGELRDPTFGTVANALRLERSVEMYQWVEDVETTTKKKTGGKKETTKTYTYEKEWSSSLHSSSSFEHAEGHENPSSIEFSSDEWLASRVTVDQFTLSDALVQKISNESVLAMTAETLASVPDHLRARIRLHGEGYYLGADPANPAVGDLRVTFRQVLPTDVTVVAGQMGSALGGYQTSAGDVLAMLSVGTKSPDEMFAAAEEANKMMTWILRALGFVLMAVGIGLVLRPLVVVADVVPFIGDIVGMGTGFVAMVIALPFSLLTIGVAWIFYRPLLGGGLIATAVAIIIGAKMMAGGRRAPARMPPPPPA